MSYEEDGPDEYAVRFVADFALASAITFKWSFTTRTMYAREIEVHWRPFPGVPTLERLTYSPKEDDTYIYEVIMA